MPGQLQTAVEAKAIERGEGKPSVEQSLQQLIERQQTAIARALPRGMSEERFARILVTTVKQTPGLLKCDPVSFLGAAMTAAQLGLEPGPLGEAYLVPYGTTCTFIPGAPGLIKLAIQSGFVTGVIARTVYEGDEFDYEYGLDERLKHKPGEAETGKATHHYAVAKFPGGGHEFVVMTQAQVDNHRRKFAKSDKAWREHPEAMARKTLVKQLMKFLPKSAELASAVDSDGRAFSLSGAGVSLVDAVDLGNISHGEHADAIDVPDSDSPQQLETESSGA